MVVSDPLAMNGSIWEVVGGGAKGGLIVRAGKDTSTSEVGARLATGAIIRELEHDPTGRLRYELVSGTGPASGWVSTRVGAKELVVQAGEEAAAERDRKEALLQYAHRFGATAAGGQAEIMGKSSKAFSWHQSFGPAAAPKPAREVREELERELSRKPPGRQQPHQGGGGFVPTFAYAAGTYKNQRFAKFDARDEACVRVGGFRHGQVLRDSGGHEFAVVGVRPQKGAMRLWLQPLTLGKPGSFAYEGHPAESLRTTGATQRLCETSIRDYDAAEDSDEEDLQLCGECRLPLGAMAYDGRGGACVHGECLAQSHARRLNEEAAAGQRRELALKEARHAEYKIGWKAEQIPSNVRSLAKLGHTPAPQGMCCLVLDESSGTLGVAATAEPAAAVNLEYLSLALRARCQDGKEPFFSLDPVLEVGQSDGCEAPMQVKRFEPEWLAGTSMGEVMFQADYFLKELSMGEYEQPVIGMKSCFDLFSEGGCQDRDWSAREWFVVRQADVSMSEDNVLVPHIRMGVEAREQIMGADGMEDAPLTRPDHPLVKYAKEFTHNFDLIAERRSAIHQLREVARSTVLAKYLLESGVNLEESWFHLAAAESEACCMEVPQLWNERFDSQVHVEGGKIREAEKGVRPHTRGVYGGVQFGIDSFSVGGRAAGVSAGLEKFKTSLAAQQLAVSATGQAPRMSMVFTSQSGAGLRKPVMTTLSSPIITLSPGAGLRGVDLNLDSFDVSQAARTAGTFASSVESKEAQASIGAAFWTSVDDGAKAPFKEQDVELLKDVFNPGLSDRRDEGALFVPPATGAAYVRRLQGLVRAETAVREERTQHFLSKQFSEEDAGSLFPSSWQSSFQVARVSKEEQGGLLHARPDYKAQAAAFDHVLRSAAPAFDKSTEDGVRFRIYRFGGIEVRTTQGPCGEEAVGAVFSMSTALEGRQGQGAGDREEVVKVTEYIERAKDAALHHSYVVLETDKGSTILTERLASGASTWEENPRGLEVRNALAKVLRSVECSVARIAVRDMRSHQARFNKPGNSASASKCKRYARGAYDRAQAPQVMALAKKEAKA